MSVLVFAMLVFVWTIFILTAQSAAAVSGLALPEPHTMLQKHFDFSSKDIRKMEDGEIVAKVLNLGVSHEIAGIGVVRTTAPKERLIEQFRDIVSFKKDPLVEEIGKFSRPPRLEDVRGLTLDEKDLDALGRCVPGDCKLKMDRNLIERFQREVDWKAADAKEQAEDLMRRFLIDYVTAYLERGEAALGVYNDKEQAKGIAEAFENLLQDAAYLREYLPELEEHLLEFPRGSLRQSEDFIYWSKEKLGPKAAISVSHVTMYRREHADGEDVFITSKQLYANHYFETSLGMSFFMDAVNTNGPPASYLIYLNRSRLDILRGMLWKIIRPIANKKIKSGFTKNFQRVKERLETAE